MVVAWAEAPATRRDEAAGAQEVGFVGDDGARVLVARHAPDGAVLGVAVVCPSICNDFLRGYRRDVLIARELARRGWLALRFHYRGTGHSDGDAADLDVESMRADIERVLDLGAAEHPGPPALVATRFAAPIAAMAAAGRPGARLALVEPSTALDRFFREAWGTWLIRKVSDEAAVEAKIDDLLAHLRATGSVDVLGFEVHARLVDSAAGRTLVDEVPADSGGVLMLQLGGKVTRRDVVAAAEALTERGIDVEVHRHGQTQAWWVLDAEEPVDPGVVDLVARWVTGVERGPA